MADIELAREKIKAVAADRLVPALKASGFKKSGLTFVRRRGETAHFIQLQLSSWNQGPNGNFYVNVGVMFDEMRRHRGNELIDLPKYDDCQFMVRLERLVPSAPAHWAVGPETDIASVSSLLADYVVGTVVHRLDSVSSLAAFELTGWVKAVPWGFPAVYYYLIGRDKEAADAIAAEAEVFKDRGSTYKALAERYGLTRLQR